MQASNVIVPVIDLTASAEGSSIGTSLQQALSFASQTSVQSISTTKTLASNAGFWKVDYQLRAASNTSFTGFSAIRLTDGLAVKNVVECQSETTTTTDINSVFGSIIVYLDAGDSILVVSSDARSPAFATARQVATTTGELINPAGFTPE